jgi:hypothetical protein
MAQGHLFDQLNTYLLSDITFYFYLHKINNQNYILFYKLISCNVLRDVERAYPAISPR